MNTTLMRALGATIMLVLGTSLAQAGDPFAGTFRDDRLTLTLNLAIDGYLGEILFEGQRFPVQAQPSGAGLAGTFHTTTGAYPFEAHWDGGALVLTTGGTSYRLQPLAAAGAFRTLAPPAGRGQLLLGSLPATTATEALLGATEQLFGHLTPRPTFLGGIADRQGTLMQAPFVATVDGHGVFGVAVAHLGRPGVADLGFAFDLAERAPETLDGLVAELGRHLPLPQSAAPAAAPVSSWRTVPFPDGSGRLSLPDTWVLTAATQGMVDAAGPAGAEVHLGLWAPISTPESAVNPFTGQPYPGILAAPLLEPAEAVAALFPQMFAAFGSDYLMGAVLDYAPTASEAGGQSAFILWDADLDGVRHRQLGLVVAAPVSYQQWLFYYSYVTAPVDSFDAALPTMMEIWGRWDINPALFRQRLQNAAQSMQEAGQIIIDSFDANQQRIDAASYGWSEAFRGVAIVQDTVTGEEGAAALGWIDQTIDALNRNAGYERFEYVPLDRWWLGAGSTE